MNSSVTAPSLKVVQAALRKITEHLAKELAQPSQTRPDWSELEWRTARAVAAMHGVSSLLATTLRWQGPAGWQTFLEEQRQHTERRHQRIAELLLLLDNATRGSGIPAMALKGAALYSLGLYSAGQRPMADVDLLVRKEDVELTTSLLQPLGYHATHSNWRHRSFSPIDTNPRANLGEHADNYLKIELHERISEPLPMRKAVLTHFLGGTRASPGLNPYPSNAALMAHLLLHAAGGMVTRSLRLLHLHDIVLLAGRMTGEEWLALAQWPENDNEPWWALPPLALAAHYYPGAIPIPALQALARYCPPRLCSIVPGIRLTDVSLSSLWIEALPGIGWSRSVGEAAQYIFNRIFPDQEKISQRKYLATSEPGFSQNRWAHFSQATRILRGLISRPPRPATMYAVRASLDSGCSVG
jgi:Uncharacterised nucleotidyltransferase